MNGHDFIERFGGVFEHSPWVAEGAWDAGLNLDSAGELHARMCAVLRSASRNAACAAYRPGFRLAVPCA